VTASPEVVHAGADLLVLSALAPRPTPVFWEELAHLAVIAQFDPDWGATDAVRATLAPIRTR
jgi:hypothetical protein